MKLYDTSLFLLVSFVYSSSLVFEEESEGLINLRAKRASATGGHNQNNGHHNDDHDKDDHDNDDLDQSGCGSGDIITCDANIHCNGAPNVCSIDCFSDAVTCICKEDSDGETAYGQFCQYKACDDIDKNEEGIESCTADNPHVPSSVKVVCKTGYYTEIGERYCDKKFCDPTPCENGSRCVVNWNNDDFTCLCNDADFGLPYGKYCDKNICLHDFSGVEQPHTYNKCVNGKCVANGEAFDCICEKGWSKDLKGICKVDQTLCENNESQCKEMCAKTDCVNGKCIISKIKDILTATCDCSLGYSGDKCEIKNSCIADKPCDQYNTEKCVSSGHDLFTCHCKPGFSGATCEYDPCHKDSPYYTCDDDIYSDVSSCKVVDSSKGKIGVCVCKDNPNRTDCAVWGPICATGGRNDCSLEGTKACDVKNGKAVCICKTGYSGPNCQTWDKDPCSVDNNPCHPPGTVSCNVINSGKQAQCICEPGWSGDDCSTSPEIPCECNTNKVEAWPGVYLIPKKECNAGKCVCNTFFSGEKCEIFKNPCTICSKDYTKECRIDRYNAMCLCQEGWFGRDCNTKLDDACTDYCNEDNSIECVIEDGNPKCVCEDEWSGDTCDSKLSIPTCPSYEESGKVGKKPINLSLIFKLAGLFSDSVRTKDSCYELIKNRIFGPIKLSDGNVLEDSAKWLGLLKKMENDDKVLNWYADTFIKELFKEAFNGCAKGSCVAKKFCTSFAEKHGDLSYGADMINKIRENCDYESWRINELIMDPMSDACEHKYVPLGMSEKCEE